MDVFTVAAVLSLLSVSAAKPLQNCEDLIQPVAFNKTQILGKWIYFEGTADYPKHADFLKTLNSSFVETVLSSDGNTAVMKETYMLNGKCVYSDINTTFSDNMLHMTEDNVTWNCSVLHACPDCLVMRCTGLDDGDIIKSVYIAGRTKTLNESDLNMYREQVKCLGLPQPMFTYDGTQDFCPERET